MQNSSQQNRAPVNKASQAGGWAPKARDFASNRRFLAKQQAANDLRKQKLAKGATAGGPATAATVPASTAPQS